MININTNKTLNIILPNTNRALKEVLESSSPKELQTLSTGKDLKSVIDTILSKSAQDPSQDKALLNLVKTNPTLKELGSITSNAKELHNLLKQDKNPLPLEKQLENFLSNIRDISEKNIQKKIENSGVFLESKLKNFQTPKETLKELTSELSKLLQDTKLPNVKTLNEQLQKLFSTSKLDMSSLIELSKSVQSSLESITQRIESPLDKKISPDDVLFSKEVKSIIEKLQPLTKPEQLHSHVKMQELFSNDFKVALLKAQEELNNSTHPNRQELLKHIDRLTLVIDYHQLVSHLSNATSLYIPYSWDALEDGNLTIKKLKDGKFFTDIELELKEYGLLKLRLGMFEEKQLNINISTQNSELKTLLQENISQLRQQLSSIGITPKEIRFLDDALNTHSYNQSQQNIALGFEVKA